MCLRVDTIHIIVLTSNGYRCRYKRKSATAAVAGGTDLEKEAMAMVNRFPVSDEMITLRDAMGRLLEQSFVGSPFRLAWSPNNDGRIGLPVDVYATQDEIVVIAAVPGARMDDLDITVNQNVITLNGTLLNVASSEEAKHATWYVHELPTGKFQRSISLPIEIDAGRATATLDDGILRLILPKADQARPRQITIQTGQAGKQQQIGAESQHAPQES
jgi:HSP20 family protein